MARWVLEPGHTAAGFSVRHMMVTEVRGAFKKVEGVLEFDPESPGESSVDVTILAGGIWSGDKDRDAHLAAPDFLDVEKHKTITLQGRRCRRERFSGPWGVDDPWNHPRCHLERAVPRSVGHAVVGKR